MKKLCALLLVFSLISGGLFAMQGEGEEKDENLGISAATFAALEGNSGLTGNRCNRGTSGPISRSNSSQPLVAPDVGVGLINRLLATLVALMRHPIAWLGSWRWW